MTNKVLLTGGAGYIGSHVAKALFQKGFQPIVYDDLSQGTPETAKWGPLIEGSICHKKSLEKLFTKHDFISIIHLAAFINPLESQKDPLSYYQNNVMGTLSLLKSAKNFNIPYFIFSSSCAVYGNPEKVPVKETDPKKPINVYGQTKLMSENMLEALAASSDLKVAILRYFNVAGADPEGELGETCEKGFRLIPRLIEIMLKKDKSFIMNGDSHPTNDGSTIRDYIHVTDLAAAHVKTLQRLIKKKENLTLNLGAEKGYSIKEILQMIEKIFNYKIPVKVGSKKNGDAPIFISNSEKAKQLLNWETHYSDLPTLLKTTKNWMEK